MVTTSSAFPNIVKDIADLAKRVRDEEAEQFFTMEEAEKHIKKAAEDRRLQELQ